jgi:hypothetical protein
MFRGLLLTLLLATTVLAITMWGTPHEAAGAPVVPLRVVAQRGGLRLELSVPHSTYPRDALIRVWAVARNTTRHTLWIEGGGPQAPGKYLPQVEVLNGAGRSLPLSLTTYFPYPGPMSGPSSLAPGATVGGAEDVVLRGSWVRVGINLLRDGTLPVRSGVAFHTRALQMHLLPPDPPTVQLNASTDNASATIVRPTNVHGLPQAVWYADCGGTDFDQRSYWSPVSTHFAAGCSPLHAWHVLVGWRGHSVAAIESPGG